MGPDARTGAKAEAGAPSVPGLHAWITPLLGKGPLREFKVAMANDIRVFQYFNNLHSCASICMLNTIPEAAHILPTPFSLSPSLPPFFLPCLPHPQTVSFEESGGCNYGPVPMGAGTHMG